MAGEEFRDLGQSGWHDWDRTVTEVRYTPFGSGQVFYRLYVPMDPEPLMLEVREDEVECLVPHA